jgi:ElaB/YqjD/DUF883 family membrane-anchored ribosome-binding protein
LGKRPHFVSGTGKVAWNRQRQKIFLEQKERKKQAMATKSESETDESTEKLLKDLREVVEDGEELLRAGASELNEKGTAARARLSAALETAKDTGRKLQQKSMESAKATDRLIREHPYETLGIAFGIGVLVGVLINRR